MEGRKRCSRVSLRDAKKVKAHLLGEEPVGVNCEFAVSDSGCLSPTCSHPNGQCTANAEESGNTPGSRHLFFNAHQAGAVASAEIAKTRMRNKSSRRQHRQWSVEHHWAQRDTLEKIPWAYTTSAVRRRRNVEGSDVWSTESGWGIDELRIWSVPKNHRCTYHVLFVVLRCAVLCCVVERPMSAVRCARGACVCAHAGVWVAFS